MIVPVRVEAFGAAIALTCGLLLGGAMHPNLANDDRPAGPQMIAGWAGMRSTGPFDGGTTLASYGAEPPDYVMGSDAKKAMTWTPPPAATAPPAPRYAEAETAQDDLPTISRAAYDDDAPPERPHYYPSLGPPPAADSGDDSATPTITG